MEATAAVSEILVTSGPRAVRHRGTARAWGGQRGAGIRWGGEPNVRPHLIGGPRPGPPPGRPTRTRAPAPCLGQAPGGPRDDGPTAPRPRPGSRPGRPA